MTNAVGTLELPLGVIGASTGTVEQDQEVAEAGAAAFSQPPESPIVPKTGCREH
jgi:hypothetical protein